MSNNGLCLVYCGYFEYYTGCVLCAGPGNLPTDTDLVVAVAADPVWLEGRGLNMTELRTILTSALREERCQRDFVEV